MRTFLFLALILATALPNLGHAEELNAGFVQGLWYSNDNVFADVPVRIYAAVRNNTGDDLTGRVEFYINDTRIERMDVQALNGRIVEGWADWTPPYGTSTVRAVLTRTRLTSIGSTVESVTVASTESEQILFVDYDTDEDGIGNTEDTDDDNDGVSDTDEEQNDTNPLVFNEPSIKSEEDSSDSQEGKPTSNDHSSVDNKPAMVTAGLEQYLTESRADTMFAGITEKVNNSKKSLDTYRANRNETISQNNKTNGNESTASDGTQSTSTDYSEEGFGEITRTQEEKGSTIGNIFAGIVSGTAAILSAGYTLILFLTSLYLSNPMAVQVTLLLLILFILYKLAKRLSSRPQ